MNKNILIVSVDLSLAEAARSSDRPFDRLSIPSFETGTVEADKVLKPAQENSTPVLYRKNLKPVSYVMSGLSGSEESPVYGILKLAPQIKYPLQTAEVPWNTMNPVVKWDGEWFITYEVFRGLGGAFAVVMLLIYILVLGWFRSFTVPLIERDKILSARNRSKEAATDLSPASTLFKSFKLAAFEYKFNPTSRPCHRAN